MMKKTTTLQSIVKTVALATVFLGTIAVHAQEPIFLEDFTTITTGDNTTLDGSETAWAANSNFRTAWRTFQAGGALRLGNGNASANLGYVTTQNIDLSVNGGLFTLSFDVKGWETVENQIKVIITGLETQFVTYTATMDQPFENISLQFTGGVENSRIIIETTEKRAFIDNIKIVPTVEEQILASPVATPPSDIISSGFTANWGRVSGATGYILDVSMSLEFDSFVPGYEGIVLGDSWSYPVEGLMANSQYFYRVKATNENVTSITSNVIGAVTAQIMGNNQFSTLGLQYYPSPVKDVLNLTAAKSLSLVEVYTVAGQKVISKALNTTNTALDMSALSAGYYMVKVTSGSENATLKVIKE
ncbi:T9SS type A sorting domain-containing protein [Flavobacterium sp. Sd200]|uniref:T9SS type A sorting domain-containing protein n=1 Tax=Flavobacterium sp. Sd200 TaxID=2692211 RepID=UPI0013722504|nr:T9SS type A sorting domain-containing protein [Flavobacterium sp. Sd200]MXN89884.1 T9SS type A sorting domain-containing protein [Flavobacterium sp. Sd200]